MQMSAFWDFVLWSERKMFAVVPWKGAGGREAPAGPLWPLPPDFMLALQLQREKRKI